MRPTTFCTKCQKNISNNNIKRHFISCAGPKIKKERGIDFDPNIGFLNGSRSSWNKGLIKSTDPRVNKNAKSIARTWKPKGAILLTSLQLSENAKRNNFGGYRQNAGRSKKFKVLDTFGNSVTLQSSYELAVFEILCELGVSWIRPRAIKYDDKKYFADFYLPDFDVWLDPKNDFKAEQDEIKIKKVIEQNRIKLFVLLKHQINKDYIARII